MNSKRLWVLTILLIILTSPIFASLVSFKLVETGLNEGIPGPAHGSVWEGGLMEVFFDAGYIVTNSPLSRIERRPEPNLSGIILDDFEEAAIGGAEFFILSFLECQIQGGRAIPLDMTLKIYATDSKRLIFEQSFPMNSERTLAQEFDFAKGVGRIILNHLN